MYVPRPPLFAEFSSVGGAGEKKAILCTGVVKWLNKGKKIKEEKRRKGPKSIRRNNSYSEIKPRIQYYDWLLHVVFFSFFLSFFFCFLFFVFCFFDILLNRRLGYQEQQQQQHLLFFIFYFLFILFYFMFFIYIHFLIFWINCADNDKIKVQVGIEGNTFLIGQPTNKNNISHNR